MHKKILRVIVLIMVLLTSVSATPPSKAQTGSTTTIPAAPSSLFKIGPTDQTAIYLSWLDNSTNETSFNIKRRIAGGAWLSLTNISANNTSIAYYTDSGLTPATSYEYQVQACNSAGCSAFVTSPAILTQSSSTAITLPAAPSSLFKIGPTTESAIYLSWLDNSTNETSFSLQRRKTGGTWSNPISVSANNTSIAYYTDTGLLPGTSYEYQVQACISSNCSAFTASPAILTQSSAPTLPNPPTGLTSSAGPTATAVYLFWNDNSLDETHFNLLRRVSGGAWAIQASIPSSSLTSKYYTDQAVQAGTSYEYQVQACREGAGCSTYSNTFAVSTPSATIISPATPIVTIATTTSMITAIAPTTVDLIPPTAPTNLTGYTSTLAYINISWSASSDNVAVAGYKIYRNGAFLTTGPSISGQTDYYYFDDEVLPGLEYTYYVVAYDTGGLISAPSASFTIRNYSESNTTATTAPTTPITTTTPPLTLYNTMPTATIATSAFSYLTQPTTTKPAIIQYGYIRGSISDFYGNPIPYATAYIWNDSGMHRSVVADASGNFYLNAPAGNFQMEIILPSTRTDLTKPAPSNVSLLAGENKELKITIQKINAVEKTIKGKVSLDDASPVEGARINIYNQLSKQWLDTTTDSDGEYSLQVGSGVWMVGIKQAYPPSYWFWNGSPVKVDLTGGSQETKEVNFTVNGGASQLTISLIDEDGLPIGGAGVSVETKSTISSDTALAHPPSAQYLKSDSFGNATFKLQNGSYVVRTFLPDQDYLNPGEKIVEINSADQIIELIFKNKSAAKSEIIGKVRLESGASASEAYVTAWSKSGEFDDLKADEFGNFTIQSVPGDVWHIGAGMEIDRTLFKAPEVIVTAKSASTPVSLTLIKIQSTEIVPIVVSTQVDRPALAVVDTGASVYVPEKSIKAVGDSPVTISVAQTADAPSRADARVVGNAYDVKIKDNSGKEIKEFNNDLEINLPYTDEMLASLGTTDDAVRPSYFDESTGAWVKIDNYTIDKVKHVVVIRIRHLTRFALVAPADTTPPPAPTKLAFFVMTPGALTLTWANPKADFHHVKVYRSENRKSIGKVINDLVTKNNFSDSKLIKKTYYYTLRSVDAAGNESKNTKIVTINAAKTTKMPILVGLSKGKRAAAVKTLQKSLVIAGFLSPDFPYNNLFDDQTFLAVKAFQKQNKLPENGKIDSKTANLLNKIYLLNQTP